jgi:acetaldehyde dehydrogenase/alcohol dehydrogenase
VWRGCIWKSVPGRRVLIVTDKVLTKLGVTDRAKSSLKKNSPEIRVFDDVEPEPSVATVMRTLEEHRDFNPDVIVGIGGGSAIDEAGLSGLSGTSLADF